jgi:molecular chaperone DnaK (HSP70)
MLTDYLVELLVKDKGMDVSKAPKIMQKLKILSTEAKHTLS